MVMTGVSVMRPANPSPQASDAGSGHPAISTDERLPRASDTSPNGWGCVLARPHGCGYWMTVRWSHVTRRDYAEWRRTTEDHIP